MTIDDRSVREHLDRRAESGATDPDSLADAVMARVASVDAGPWWRRRRVGAPSLGIAAAALLMVVAALAVLPPRLSPGPGTSPSSSASAVARPYPADRALTVSELDAVLGTDPAARAGEIVIANASLETYDMFCYGTECPRYMAVFLGRSIGVHDPGEPELELPGPGVFRIRPDGNLDLLGYARAGRDGLAWTLPQLTAELATLRGPSVRPVLYLYLVVGWHAVAPFQPTCAPATGDPRFGCGDLEAWLVPDEATVRGLSTGLVSTPAAGIRVPNGGQSGDAQAGFWLVDPWVDQSGCTRCPPGGAADLIGRIISLQELGVSP